MCAFCELSLMKNLKGTDAVLKLFSTSTVFAFLAVTVEFDAGLFDLIARQFRFLPPLNRSCTESQLH